MKLDFFGFSNSHCIKECHLSIVKYLIEKQNDDKNIKNEYEQTPYHCACFFGHLSIVEYLISKDASIEAHH